MFSYRQLNLYRSVLLAVMLIILLSWASWGQTVSREQAMLAARQLSTAFAMAASQVKPAVVNISTFSAFEPSPGSLNDSQNRPQVFVHSDYYGSSWQVTFNTGISYDPVWSPTGGRLAFVSTHAGNDDVYVVNTDGSDQQRLTFNQWEWDKHPTWSPDGTQIVFWSNQDSGRRQLWIMNADGSDRRTLLDSAYNDWDPVWVKP